MSRITRNIRMLVRYSAWANERLFALLSTLPGEVVTARHASGFASIVNTLNHAHVVDLIWMVHLEGREHGFTARVTKQEPPMAALRSAQALLDQWYVDYADRLTDAAHDETLRFKFVDGGAGAMSRGDMLLHVVNHKTYHQHRKRAGLRGGRSQWLPVVESVFRPHSVHCGPVPDLSVTERDRHSR